MRLLVYFGVALLVAGALTIMAACLEYEVNMFPVALGTVMASMGLVLSYVGLKAKDDINQAPPTYPLSYAEFELESYAENAKKVSGNRAFGFVLMSMSVFILAVSGIFGLFMFWPLTLLGACCLCGGIVLCKKK
jgi:hypothetical protein